jgi:hypothetical protein
VLAAIAIVVAAGVGIASRWLPFGADRRIDADATALRVSPEAGPARDAGAATKVDAEAAPRPVEAGPAPRSDAAAGADADAPTVAPPPVRPAVVTFNSQPWSFVYVNNRKLAGHTPIRDVKLPPGRYVVRFVNPELSLSKTTNVRLAPGEHQFIKVRLDGSEAGGETP